MSVAPLMSHLPVVPESSISDLDRVIDEGWHLLEAFSAGDVRSPPQLSALLLSSCAGVFTIHGHRNAMQCLAPQLVQRALSVDIQQSHIALRVPPGTFVLVTILLSTFATRVLVPAMAQPLESKPVGLDELEGLCVQVLHWGRGIPPAAERHIMLALAAVELVLRDPDEVVMALGAVAAAPASSPHSALVHVKVWAAVLDVLGDSRIGFGPVRRAQHRMALSRQMGVLLELSDEVIQTGEWLHVHLAAKAVSHGLQMMSHGCTGAAAERFARFFEVLPHSSLWKWASSLCATCQDVSESKADDVEVPLQLMVDALRLCTVLTPGTEALVHSALAVATHLSEQRRHRTGLAVGSRLIGVVMESAAHLIVLDCADSPLVQLLSSGSRVLLQLLQEPADCGGSDEALLCVCEGINSLAEVLRADPIPPMEPTDDPDDYEEVIIAMRETNGMKERALLVLRDYLCCCQAALAMRLERFAQTECSADDSPLEAVAAAVLGEENLFEVGMECSATAMWVTYERLYDLIGALPAEVTESGNFTSVFARLPCFTALQRYLAEDLPAALQAGRHSLAVRYEIVLVPAAVHRCLHGNPNGELLLNFRETVSSCLLGLLMLIWRESGGNVCGLAPLCRALRQLWERNDVPPPLRESVSQCLWQVAVQSASRGPAACSSHRTQVRYVEAVLEVCETLAQRLEEDPSVVASSLALPASTPALARVALHAVVPLRAEHDAVELLESLAVAARECMTFLSEQRSIEYAARVGARVSWQLAAFFRSSQDSAGALRLGFGLLDWCRSHGARDNGGATLFVAPLSASLPAAMRQSFLLEATPILLSMSEVRQSGWLWRSALSTDTLVAIAAAYRGGGDMHYLLHCLADRLAELQRSEHPSPSSDTWWSLLLTCTRSGYLLYEAGSTDRHDTDVNDLPSPQREVEVQHYWCAAQPRASCEGGTLHSFVQLAQLSMALWECGWSALERAEFPWENSSNSATTRSLAMDVRDAVARLLGCWRTYKMYCALHALPSSPDLESTPLVVALSKAADFYERRALLTPK